MAYPEYPKTPEAERLIKESAERMKRNMKLLESLEAEMLAVLSPKQKDTANYYAVCIYNATRHFVQVSRDLDDIANAIQMPSQVVLWLSELPAWEKGVRAWSDTDDTQQHLQRSTSVPRTLREAYLIQEVFQKYTPIRLVTYDGFIDTRVKKVTRYELILEDGRQLPKHDVILAFPQDRMSYVKKGIKRRSSLADLSLKPIISIRDRPKINVVARIRDNIECVMRNGLVVSGENIWVSKYNIVMRVGGKRGHGGKVVLLYRHALHGFRVLKNLSDPALESGDDFATELDDGNDVDAESQSKLECSDLEK